MDHALLLGFRENEQGRLAMMLRCLGPDMNTARQVVLDRVVELTCLMTGRVYRGASQVGPALLLCQILHMRQAETAPLKPPSVSAEGASEMAEPLGDTPAAAGPAVAQPDGVDDSQSKLSEDAIRLLVAIALLDGKLDADELKILQGQASAEQLRKISDEFERDGQSPRSRLQAMLMPLLGNRHKLVWLRWYARIIAEANGQLDEQERWLLDLLEGQLEHLETPT